MKSSPEQDNRAMANITPQPQRPKLPPILLAAPIRPADQPDLSAISFGPNESRTFSLTVSFPSSSDDPTGRGVIDRIVADLKSQGLIVRNVAMQLPAGDLESPRQVKTRIRNRRIAAELRERSPLHADG